MSTESTEATPAKARELGEPIAWMFELAAAIKCDGYSHSYCDWGPPQLSFTKPCVPEESIRNLVPLFAPACSSPAAEIREAAARYLDDRAASCWGAADSMDAEPCRDRRDLDDKGRMARNLRRRGDEYALDASAIRALPLPASPPASDVIEAAPPNRVDEVAAAVCAHPLLNGVGEEALSEFHGFVQELLAGLSSSAANDACRGIAAAVRAAFPDDAGNDAAGEVERLRAEVERNKRGWEKAFDLAFKHQERANAAESLLAACNKRIAELERAHNDRTWLSENNWSVAVHNDYRQNGGKYTFWLFTHPSGRWVKGEGGTDEAAIADAAAHARALATEREDG